MNRNLWEKIKQTPLLYILIGALLPVVFCISVLAIGFVAVFTGAVLGDDFSLYRFNSETHIYASNMRTGLRVICPLGAALGLYFWWRICAVGE